MASLVLAMATAGVLVNVFDVRQLGGSSSKKDGNPTEPREKSPSETAVVKYTDQTELIKHSTPWFDPHSFKWTTLVGGTFGGALTVGLIPGARLVGSVLLLTSMYSVYQQGITKEVGIAALAVTNPAALGNLAFTATKETITQAVQLSGTVIGVLVTVSGAVVGYVVLNKKREN